MAMGLLLVALALCCVNANLGGIVMNWNIRYGKTFVPVQGSTAKDQAAAAIAAAKQGMIVTCWCSDPQKIADALVSKGLAAAVAGVDQKRHVVINGHPQTSVSEDLAVLSAL